MPQKLIYTLGTDRRSREDFIEILLSYGVEAFLDVRSFPRSKIPLFQRETLEELLPMHGIEYHFLGRQLGGLRKGGYISYILTEDFRKGIDEVEEIARQNKSVIVCAERFPWKCHRKWISRELHKRGWEVDHIIDKGKLWVPR
ncbi:Conserved Archaeal protein [Candidatus Sulfobium mesophilum]|uniref:Conserved Archaeal protein n=1 Tax=Candidatus Sulfobium mesophilum TaxID=2016548 RepID=A0A2U3QHA1_9BACT|nr:Conserved Archaeal protein [Candidatus Sulfobium mesophilum]